MKKCLSVSMSWEKSRGSIPVSMHKLTAGDDRKAPVMALRQRFPTYGHKAKMGHGKFQLGHRNFIIFTLLDIFCAKWN